MARWPGTTGRAVPGGNQEGEGTLMIQCFIFIGCELGKTYQVCNHISDLMDKCHDEYGVVSDNIYSISGEYDVLLSVKFSDHRNIGRFVSEKLHCTPHIVKTNTVIAFNAFPT